MKNLKKLLSLLMVAAIATLGVSLSVAETETAAIRVASMKGAGL